MVALAEPTAEEYAAARAGLSFWTYLTYVHEWTPRPHQYRWMSALQALGDGKLRHPDNPQCDDCIAEEEAWIALIGDPYPTGFRACANCPTTTKLCIPAWPGSGKTDTLIEWSAWMIGRATYEGLTPQAGWVSYSEKMAAKCSVAIRDTIAFMKRYHMVFPMAVPQKGKGFGETEWFLQRDDPDLKDPTMLASGFSGSILGARFSTCLVIDDPHHPELVRSPGQRDITWNTWADTIETRAAQGFTPFVLGSNRWAEDDMVGRIQMTEKDWVVLRTPALDEYEETAWPPEITNKGRPVGVSTETLLRLRAKHRPSFNTKYMVLPPSSEGDTFKLFNYMGTPDHSSIVKITQFWDTATTEKTRSDLSAMSEFWTLRNGPTYLARVVNVKLDPSALIDLMIEEHDRALTISRNSYVVIENAHAGPAFVAFLESKTGMRVKSHDIKGHGKGSKRTGPRDLPSRAAAIVKHVTEGDIRVPYGVNPHGDRVAGHWEPWMVEFATQVMGYGEGGTGHDDIVASFVGGIEYLYPHRGTSFQKVNVVMTGWGY